MYFTIERREGGFRAYARGGNSEIVFSTETYTRKSAAWEAINMLKAGAATAAVYDRTI